MLRYIIKQSLYLSLIFISLTSSLSSQEGISPVQGSSWSIVGSGSYNVPASSSMRGSIAEFRADVAKDYNNSKYPFADPYYSLGWSAKLLYALPSSAHTDLFLGCSGNYIEARGDNTLDKGYMAVWGVNIGAEYSVFPRWNSWNIFGRASLSASFINGFTDYDYFFGTFRTNVPLAGRLGVEGELGGRFIIPSTAIGLELSGVYLNANLLGKSYSNPPVVPNSSLYERQLNDGANPNNTNDKSRTIDFLCIRLGIRIWL